jgi:hypothetical protein
MEKYFKAYNSLALLVFDAVNNTLSLQYPCKGNLQSLFSLRQNPANDLLYQIHILISFSAAFAPDVQVIVMHRERPSQ